MNEVSFKYTGAIHIHTTLSDGTGNIDTITQKAKNAGLTWLIITDHNYIDNNEGIINGIYVIKGQEISPKHENHYIAINTYKNYSSENDIQTNIEKIRLTGGFGFAAHPDEKDNRNNSNKPIRWLDKNIEPDGIEIWNLFSQWGDRYDSRNIITAAYSYIFKNRLITSPYQETMKWWDDLNKKYDKIIPAIGGADAHELIRRDFIIPVKVLSYKYSFNGIINEIILKKELSKDFREAKYQILNAIKSGNNTILNKLVNRNSPEIFIQNTTSRAYPGNTIILDDETFLNINTNKKTKILVFRNGLKYNEHISESLKIKLTEIGKYRIELKFNDFGYVYTNPIIVKKR